MCRYFSLKVFAKNCLDFISAYIKTELTAKPGNFIHIFVLTQRFKTNKNEIKRLLILQRSEYSCDSVNKTLLVCCFARSSCFSCGVDTPRENITLRACVLSSVFLPIIIISLGVSFKEIWFLAKTESNKRFTTLFCWHNWQVFHVHISNFSIQACVSLDMDHKYLQRLLGYKGKE